MKKVIFQQQNSTNSTYDVTNEMFDFTGQNPFGAPQGGHTILCTDC